jgi:hypothetical protein
MFTTVVCACGARHCFCFATTRITHATGTLCSAWVGPHLCVCVVCRLRNPYAANPRNSRAHCTQVLAKLLAAAVLTHGMGCHGDPQPSVCVPCLLGLVVFIVLSCCWPCCGQGARLGLAPGRRCACLISTHALAQETQVACSDKLLPWHTLQVSRGWFDNQQHVGVWGRRSQPVRRMCGRGAMSRCLPAALPIVLFTSAHNAYRWCRNRCESNRKAPQNQSPMRSSNTARTHQHPNNTNTATRSRTPPPVI